eukprot:CAMPEP_0202876342 /NCGR_PEP_ID=MMETSP1391-20130828/28835_1 /ASSEMBLY_ACC=CAM_ASM_000867 /TAXON_ID=1034604 /ORGANISM="Chlamydomonas leiostraca, Strain SAG 11-49" /LENGTH=256 /DNA_ID=CAMNT_0049558165 /DNA_START=72 /DNA_END=839 /DNA_ORIENTATION=-
MDVRKKIGILSGNPQRENHEEPEPQQGEGENTRHPKEATALKLWREWASETLGPMSSEPTHTELSTKSKKIKNLERKCADLAARAQRRLEVSAALRSALAGGVGGAAAWAGSPRSSMSRSAGATATQPPPVGGREAVWAAREARRAAAYDAVRTIGAAEREAHQGLSASPSTNSIAAPALKSRAMLDAILASNSAGGGRPGSARRPSGVHAATKPWDTPPGSTGAGGLGSLTRVGSFGASNVGVAASSSGPGGRMR